MITRFDIPACFKSIAVWYAESLFVKTAIFFPGRTAYRLTYSETAEANITPGRSLFEKTSGRSNAP